MSKSFEGTIEVRSISELLDKTGSLAGYNFIIDKSGENVSYKVTFEALNAFFEHNNIGAKQGGKAGEYYHITQAQSELLTSLWEQVTYDIADLVAENEAVNILYYDLTGSKLYYNNGTAFVEIPLGGGGGGIPEAPEDGTTYGRKDAAWVAVTGGGGSGLDKIENSVHYNDNTIHEAASLYLDEVIFNRGLTLGTTINGTKASYTLTRINLFLSDENTDIVTTPIVRVFKFDGSTYTDISSADTTLALGDNDLLANVSSLVVNQGDILKVKIITGTGTPNGSRIFADVDWVAEEVAV